MDCRIGLDDADIVRSQGRNVKRTDNACHLCQGRKIRCDGVVPSCGPCVERKTPCHYTQRKRRGPGKTKQYIGMLEERLNRVESLQQSIHSAPHCVAKEKSWRNSLGELTHCASKPANVNLRSFHWCADPVMTTYGCQNISQGRIVGARTRSIPLRKNSGSLNGRLPSQAPSFLLSNVPEQETLKSITATYDYGCLPRTIFAPIPPEIYVIPFVKIAIEGMNEFCPLLGVESHLRLLHQQLAVGPDNCHDSPSRWATVNALLAMAIQWKAANNAIGELFPVSWTHFKNAFSVLPELILQGTDIHACQAILAMAMFMHGTADARTSSHLIATTARLLQTMGLHRRNQRFPMNPDVAEEHRRVVWTTYILSSNATMKYGVPPAFGDDKIDMELPSEDPRDGLGSFTLPGMQKSVNLLRLAAELSVIQSNIHRRLFSSMAMRSSSTELLIPVTELHQQLENWKSRMPVDIRPAYTGIQSDFELPISVLHLHFVYYHAVAKIHMAVPNLERHKTPEFIESDDQFIQWERSNKLPSSQTFAVAARATLLLLRGIPLQPLPCIWQLLCYPVCALITLVAIVLENPSEVQAQLDVRLSGEFIQYLGSLEKQEGYGLQKILDGCSTLQNIAEMAVNIQQDTTQPVQSTNGGDNRRRMWERCERIRFRLSYFVDHMQLAQGLMSNIPALRKKVADIFEGLGDTLTSQTEFGPFTPEVLMPQSYNFIFGRRL